MHLYHFLTLWAIACKMTVLVDQAMRPVLLHHETNIDLACSARGIPRV